MNKILLFLPLLILLLSSCETSKITRKNISALQVSAKKQQETIELQLKNIEALQKTVESLQAIALRMETQMAALEAAQNSTLNTATEASLQPVKFPAEAANYQADASIAPAARPKTVLKTTEKGAKTAAQKGVASKEPTAPQDVLAAKPAAKPVKTIAKDKSAALKADNLLKTPVALGRVAIKDAIWLDAANYDRKPNFPQTARERLMLREINMVRANPKGYIAFVEEFIRESEKGTPVPRVPIVTTSTYGGNSKAVYDTTWTGGGFDTTKIDRKELATARELIEELRKTKPLMLLEPSRCLADVAEEQGLYLETIGKLSHSNAGGKLANERLPTGCAIAGISENLVAGTTSVRQALLQLLIDTKVTGRGHRRNILSPNQTQVGVYEVGLFGRYATGWVQEFGH